MKRRVANLPPISVTLFNQKVLERRQETAIMSSPRGSMCELCHKTYTTENAYRSHLNSKKHKENELKSSQKDHEDSTSETTKLESVQTKELPSQNEAVPSHPDAVPSQPNAGPSQPAPSLSVRPDATEDEVNATIDQKIAAARSRLSPSHCLFCPIVSSSLQSNLSHMSQMHSFFIPDADYLVDATGLITYLGEKIAVGNICIYCNTRSREFRTLEAVRKHMIDKSHCKIAYGTMKDKLEFSDFYNFEKSYPDYELRKKRRHEKREIKKVVESVENGNDEEEKEDVDDGDEWEDTDDESAEVDEVVDAVPSSETEDSDSDFDSDELDTLPGDQMTYGDTPYELVLPSGARIGHRSLKRYYAQSFSFTPSPSTEDPKSGAAIVRRLLSDKDSQLIPRKGGFGAYGSGTEVIKARNRGEAREAGRHVKEFRDQKRREQFKTQIGFRNNHQKHYRDPLLQ